MQEPGTGTRRWIWGTGLAAVLGLALLVALWRVPAPRAARQQQTPTASSWLAMLAAAPAASAPLPRDAAGLAAYDALWCGRTAPGAALAASTAEQAMVDATSALQADWRAALSARGDPRSQGLATLLGAGDSNGEGGTPRLRLAAQAAATQDPALIAWSLAACAPGADCAGLSPRLWAARDAGNLAPWLAEFARAAAAGETGSLREALYQIGRAQRDDDYGRLALGLLDQARSTDAPGLRNSAEAVTEMGIFAAQPLAGWPALRGHCLAAVAQGDLEEQRLCEVAADAVWRLDDTVTGAALAAALARRLPQADAALWAQRRRRVDAYLALQNERFEAYVGQLAAGRPCEGDVALRRFVHVLAERGERGALDTLLQGRDVDALGQAYRAAHPAPGAPAAPDVARPEAPDRSGAGRPDTP
ncbi:MAG: hypothetical protein JO224_10885 [Pelomonas sp.]|nr:hypothetical protein [Roseateles sp.]